MHMKNKNSFRTTGIFAAALFVTALTASPAMALEPFQATYKASYMGISGNGKMQLASEGQNKWNYTLNVSSNGIQLKQATTFEQKGEQWLPLTNSNNNLLLIKKNSKQGIYDWGKKEASWSGDVKADRKGPVKLQTGDLDGLLVNLALARDGSKTTKPLTYRMVDDGRAKSMTYKPAGKEEFKLGGQSKQATKLVYQDGDKEMHVWVVDGIEAPVRILQRKGGKDEIDLVMESIQ